MGILFLLIALLSAGAGALLYRFSGRRVEAWLLAIVMAIGLSWALIAHHSAILRENFEQRGLAPATEHAGDREP